MEPMVSGSWRSDSQGPYNGRYPRHIWSVDFVHDKLSNGRSYKMLTVIDEYTREALCVTAKPRMGHADVLEALYPLFLKHGKPHYIRSDLLAARVLLECLALACQTGSAT